MPPGRGHLIQAGRTQMEEGRGKADGEICSRHLEKRPLKSPKTRRRTVKSFKMTPWKRSARLYNKIARRLQAVIWNF